MSNTKQIQTVTNTHRKTVKIQLTTHALDLMKSSGYKLCFAKKIENHSYNVVWWAYDDYLSNNLFSWIPKYTLFGANFFKDKRRVQVATNTQKIQLGQEAILNQNGVLESPKTGGNSSAINLINNYSPIHPGIKQTFIGIDGSRKTRPIFVTEQPIVPGTISLTPINKVLVWFEQNINTAIMFSTTRSNSIEIDMTNMQRTTRLYDGNKWTIPPS